MWSGHFVTFICSYWPCYIPPHRYELFITIQSNNLHKAKQVCCLLEYQFKTRKIFIFPIIGFPGKYTWRWADKFCFLWLFFSWGRCSSYSWKTMCWTHLLQGFPHPPLLSYRSLIAFVSKHFLGREQFVTCWWWTVCSQTMKVMNKESFPGEKGERVWEETRTLH